MPLENVDWIRVSGKEDGLISPTRDTSTEKPRFILCEKFVRRESNERKK